MMPFWTLPLFVTVIAFLWAFSIKGEPGGYWPDPTPMFAAVGALIVSLTAWLIYFAVV